VKRGFSFFFSSRFYPTELNVIRFPALSRFTVHNLKTRYAIRTYTLVQNSLQVQRDVLNLNIPAIIGIYFISYIIGKSEYSNSKRHGKKTISLRRCGTGSEKPCTFTANSGLEHNA